MENNHTEWKVLKSEYVIQRPWLTAKRERLELPDGRIVPEYYVLEEETGFGGGEWSEIMQIYANPTSMTNKTYCFLAKNVEKITSAHLDPTEELSVYFLEQEEVRNLVLTGQIIQSLMVAPLLRYFYETDR